MLSLLILYGCAGTPATPVFDRSTIDLLDAVMTEKMASAESSGMILAVYYPGHGEFVSAKGTSETASGTAMNADYLFRIGSLTKTFTATAVLQLVDEDCIRLDDTIDKYVSGIPSGDAITIKELLMHTSGLPEYTNNEDMWTIIAADRGHSFTPQELIDYALENPITSAPGTEYHYCNTNYILLGMVFEKANKEGETLAAGIKRRIIDRLGLSNTYFPADSSFPVPYIHGYLAFSSATPEDWSIESPSFSWAAGCVISNIRDVRTYFQALYDGTLLSDDTQALKLSEWVDCGIAALPTHKYGLGWFQVAGFYGHSGSIPGYLNMAMYDPESGATIMFMFNNSINGDVIFSTFLRVLRIIMPDRPY